MSKQSLTIFASEQEHFVCNVQKGQKLTIHGSIEQGCCGKCLVDFYIPSCSLDGYWNFLIQLFMKYPEHNPMKLLGEIRQQ